MELSEQISLLDQHLSRKLYHFENSLDRQMRLLKYGQNHISDILDAIIEELNSDGVIGIPEDTVNNQLNQY